MEIRWVGVDKWQIAVAWIRLPSVGQLVWSLMSNTFPSVSRRDTDKDCTVCV